jgi:hypothetical protein
MLNKYCEFEFWRAELPQHNSLTKTPSALFSAVQNAKVLLPSQTTNWK